MLFECACESSPAIGSFFLFFETDSPNPLASPSQGLCLFDCCEFAVVLDVGGAQQCQEGADSELRMGTIVDLAAVHATAICRGQQATVTTTAIRINDVNRFMVDAFISLLLRTQVATLTRNCYLDVFYAYDGSIRVGMCSKILRL